MTEEIKEELAEAIQVYVLMGFHNKEELLESINDMFYTEENLDESWIKNVINELYDKHQLESLQWEKPTDFDKLVIAFDSLIKQKIVCWQWAGSTKQMAVYDCEEMIKELKAKGVNTLGYCYYHMQDLERAVEPESRNLYLGFDSATQDDEEAVRIGNMICEALFKNDFEYVWDGTVNERILIENINWKKVPDEQDYAKERNLNILLHS